MRAVRERSRGGLVEDAHHVETGDLAGVTGGLPLGVVEVRGHRDHRTRDRLAECFLGDRAQTAQYMGGNLLRADRLTVHADPRIAVRCGDDAKRCELGEPGDVLGVDLAADEALGSVHRGVGVGHCLAACPRTDGDGAIGRPCDPRRRGALAVGRDQRGRLSLLVEH